MSDSKIIKVRYLHHGEWKEEDYQSDGNDQINGVLESLADRYAVPLMEARERGGPRPVVHFRNLITHGISEVEIMFEDSHWVALCESDLLRV